jgi:hypothetical protein
MRSAAFVVAGRIAEVCSETVHARRADACAAPAAPSCEGWGETTAAQSELLVDRKALATRAESSSGAFGPELAEKAPVVGTDVLFDDPSSVIEFEDVHEVPDDAGLIGFKPAGR